MSNNNSQSTWLAILSVLVLALAGISIYLLTSKNSLQEANLEKQDKLEEVIQLKDSLDAQFNDAILELDEMKGTNAELNEIIEQQKTDLTAQKRKISGLIGSKRRLNEAREEIAKMTAQAEQYMAQISQLQNEKQALTQENVTLNTDLTTARSANEELTSAKAMLVSEKADLETQRAELAEKVSVGSVVKVSNVAVQGFKVRKSGKRSDKKKARNIDVLQMCFNLISNKVVEAGTETFQLVLMSPDGTPILGGTTSGSFMSKESGSEVRYTMEVTETYSNAGKEVCLDYEDPNGYQKGTYNVEIYNKGFLSGEGNFTLK